MFSRVLRWGRVAAGMARKVALGAVFAALTGSGARVAAQEVGTPWVGARGITETVDQIMARDPGLFTYKWARETRPRPILRTPKSANPAAPAVPCWPWTGRIPEATPPGPTDNPQVVGTSWLGAQISDTVGYIPPDSMGDVGTTQVLVCVNGRIRAFDKNGATGGLNTTTDTFFQSVRNGSGTSDPTVRFDRITQRWFVSCVNTATPNRVLLAVSGGPTVTATASFTFYQFQHDLVGATPNSDTGGFADYPGMGVDASAVYIGCDTFNAAGNALIGETGYVIRKTSVLSGGPIVVTPFRQMGTTTIDGPESPRGVSNYDPSATEGYFVGASTTAFGELAVRRITNPGGTPSISPSLLITVPATVFPMTTPAQNSTRPLDALDDRLFHATIWKDRATGTSTLWTAHNIQVTSGGVASNTGGRNGSRWYELQNLTATPSLRQAGTLFDAAASSPVSFWIPSMAMSGQGHAALGCSRAGTASLAGCATAGRLRADPLGAIQSPTTITGGGGTYNIQTSGTQRWGDYSATAVDPSDDQTIWTFLEYCNAGNSWGIRVAKLLAPPPATPVSCNPSSINQGDSNISIVVTGNSSSGSGFYDTQPGLNRIAAAIGGAGLTVNSITYNSPTQVTLVVSATAAATTGAQTVSITNPDGQTAISAGGILTVSATSACYANCDGSTAPPILNVNDFQCFLNLYAAGDPYANCDGSTTPPVLNVNDFQCFLNLFAIGCP